MRKFCLFFLLFWGALYAIDPEAVIQIDSASCNVRGAVNALTGQFFLQETDAVVPGFESILIQRTYVSDNELNWEGGWAVFPHDHFILYITDKGLETFIREPSGQIIRYRMQSDGVTLLPDLEHTYPLPFEREISGRTDFRNNRVILERNQSKKASFGYKKATLTLGNGSSRVYEFNGIEMAGKGFTFLLKEEIKPNGNRLVFTHGDGERLDSIVSYNPTKSKAYASIAFTYAGKKAKDRDCQLHCSDGKVVDYHFWRPEEKHLHNYFYLENVSGPGVIHREFLYDVGYKKKDGDKAFNKARGPLVKEILVGGEIFLKPSYYRPLANVPTFWGSEISVKNARDLHCQKVLDLLEPIGPEGTFVPTHSFIYEHATEKGPGVTKVKDALGNETHYYFEEHFKPKKIEFYSPQGLVRTELFSWKGQDLIVHALLDPTGENSIAREYEYDQYGNVKRETLYGNLTGTSIPLDINNLQNGIESYTVRYEYSADGFNLPMKKEEENGRTVLYTYKAGTDLLTSKFVCERNQVLIKHFYKYNDDNVLIEEILDDDVERKTTYYAPNKNNLPEVIEEKALDKSTNREILLQKRVLHYNKQYLVEQEDVHGNDGLFCYSIKTSYDPVSGNPEWQIDPLGYKTTFKYNLRYLLTQKHREGAPIEIFSYNKSGDLIKKELRDPKTEKSQVEIYGIDLLHHKISETNSFEETTIIEPDRFGAPRVVKTPLAPGIEGKSIERVSTFKRDFLSREIFRQNPNGDETTTQRNAYGNPIYILHADETEESFSYYKNGEVKEHIDCEGNAAHFENDILGRPLAKKIYSPEGTLLSAETKTHSAFHKKSQTDALGHTTMYKYDVAGHKVSEETGRVKIEFNYNSLGALSQTIQDDLVVVTDRDFLGQVIEERKEDRNGRALYKKRLAYNSIGEIVEETQFPEGVEATTIRKYDVYGRLIELRDPEGHATIYEYSLKPHTKTTIDALSRKKIETYNALGTLARLEQKDERGQTVALEEYFYDLNQNLSLQVSSIYQGTTFLKKAETRWNYGKLNRLEELIEAANTPSARKTRYKYTLKGLLYKTIKPSSLVIQNSYNGLGQLIELQSLDGTVHYTYKPNALGQVISATDLNTGLTTTRIPDDQGNFLQETLANGFTLIRTYDTFNRCRTITLPDNTLVTKTYDPVYLREIHWNGLTHQYTRYDLSGALLEEMLPLKTGTVNYTIDLLGRTKAIHSPYHIQTIGSFDPVGKIESLHTNTSTFSESASFAFDPLGQMIQDGQHIYGYNSHYNRIAKDETLTEINDLNQLTEWTYDADGNPKTRGGLSLTYDALDRLIAVDFPDQSRIAHTYDPFHRRLTKILPGKTIRYLYDGNNEIGFEENGHLSLRILGETPYAEIGSTVAISLNGTIYLPLHDLQGNVLLLFNPITQKISEEYHYSPFGEQNPTSSQNPWRYLSKHTDDETGLVFFGRRYYDPSVGRFLTSDPKGYTDSLNLYAYALNDPFALVDPYGLENEFSELSMTTLSGFSGTYNYTQAFVSMPTIGSLVLGRLMDHSPWDRDKQLALSSILAIAPQLDYGALETPLFNIEDVLSLGGGVLSKAFVTKKGFSLGGLFFAGKAAKMEASLAKELVKDAVHYTKSKFSPHTATNFRQNLIRLIEVNPGKSYHAHHIFPQKFESGFTKLGINIHDPKYGVWWEADCHLKSAQWYNNRWTEFLTESPRGKEEILDFGRHMMSQYGIKINY